MVAVRTLPPIAVTMDNIGQVIPDYTRIQNNIVPGNRRDQSAMPSKMQILDVLDLSLLTILKNIANTLILVITDLLKRSSYSNTNNFFKVFTSGNRLMYIGIIFIIFSLFLSFFFY